MSKSSLIALAFGTLALVGCRRDMQDQPKYRPLAESRFFSDHRSARPQIEGTVARGHLRLDQARYTGKINNNDIDYFPIPITRADVARGRERFDIYCLPCHSRVGDGRGMIQRRGFRQPPSYYSPKLMSAPTGHFFDVVTNGFGGMPSYASRVAPDDLWRIIAYIRALQLSMSGSVNDVPADQRASLKPLDFGPQNTNAPPANPAPQSPPVPVLTPQTNQGAPQR